MGNLINFGLADVNSSNIAQIESCAKCHARQGFVHPGHHAGDQFLDHFIPEVTQPWSPDMSVPTYHVDGQIDDEVYVYGSYIQSKMFHQGVSVSTVMILMRSSFIHTRINYVPVAMSLTRKIQLDMIHLLTIFIRSGQKCLHVLNAICRKRLTWELMREGIIVYEFPSDLSVKHGSPNACNKCHSDKDAQWAADAIDQRKGTERAREVSIRMHFMPLEPGGLTPKNFF